MIKKIFFGLFLSFLFFIIITISSLFFGYQYYTVISDSMYPSIPKYSLVYVKKVEVVDIYNLDGKVIAFYENGQPTMHRVVGFEDDKIITHGDRNEENVTEKVNKDEVIGIVVLSIPILGVLFKSIYPALILLLTCVIYLICEKLVKELKKK